MNRTTYRLAGHCPAGWGLALVAVLFLQTAACRADDDIVEAAESKSRTPWIGSRVIGSPEPPPPYIAVDAFPQIKWDRPLYVKPEPASEYLIVVQQGGEADKPSKLLRVHDLPDVDDVSLFLEMPDRLIYGLEFAPDYEHTGFVFVFSNGPTGQPERQNRVSRFTVNHSEQSVACDAGSEQIIIQWRSMGHDGGDLGFGPDGMLYITSGDGTSDSDNWVSAQDVSNLLGGMLRIDVNHPTADRAYSIPDGNPFVGLPNARGEWWAIGFRNPWRMTVDNATGQIWVGNNGQDLWETAHLVGPGENYGWSVYEGSHPFYVHRQLGPGKLTLPTFEHHHSEARSLTGGVVYRGEKFPELDGVYVYGDYATGKIWAGRHDGTQVISHREIADTRIQIAGFSNTHRGELLIVDHAGGIFRLEANPALQQADESSAFPKKLSDTGLFESVAEHRMAAGVIPYSVIAPAWNDGATAERFLAVPGDKQIDYASRRGWTFPDGTVLVQTLSREEDRGGSVSPRRIETRLLTQQQGEWAGYSYLWNEQQDEATLVDRGGVDIPLEIGGKSDTEGPQTWRIPSRAECMSCHTRAVNYVLGLTELQMNRDYRDQGNQLDYLEAHGFFSVPPDKPMEKLKKLVDPCDESMDLESRAKSYLHANCSGCHVSAGGGNARMELEFSTPLDKMQIVSQFPQHDTFGIAQPWIVAPGETERSVMLARLSRRGRGQMPPLVSNRVDDAGVALLSRWIASMQADRKFVRNWSVAELQEHLPALASDRLFERGERAFREAGCGQCHRLQNEIAGIGPNLTGISTQIKPVELLRSIIEPSANIAEQFAMTVIVTSDGEVVQGRIESETEDSLVLRGQESLATPRTIAKADIEERALSKVSMMPEATVNHLELEEILDLMAYILADADPDHAAFAASVDGPD